MVVPVRLARGRYGLLWKVVAAAYVIALATLPFGHHDLLCHLKSRTHCATCHVGTAAEDSSATPAVAPVLLADAGCASQAVPSFTAFCVPAAEAERAPPFARDLES